MPLILKKKKMVAFRTQMLKSGFFRNRKTKQKQHLQRRMTRGAVPRPSLSPSDQRRQSKKKKWLNYSGQSLPRLQTLNVLMSRRALMTRWRWRLWRRRDALMWSTNVAVLTSVLSPCCLLSAGGTFRRRSVFALLTLLPSCLWTDYLLAFYINPW